MKDLYIWFMVGLIPFFWAFSDFLSELHYRWLPEQGWTLKGKPSRFKRWLRGVEPYNPSKWFTKITFKIFYDGNHFFRNAPRIAASILVGVLLHPILGIVSLFFWFIGRQIGFSLMDKPDGL